MVFGSHAPRLTSWCSWWAPQQRPDASRHQRLLRVSGTWRQEPWPSRHALGTLASLSVAMAQVTLKRHRACCRESLTSSRPPHPMRAAGCGQQPPQMLEKEAKICLQRAEWSCKLLRLLHPNAAPLSRRPEFKSAASTSDIRSAPAVAKLS